MTEPFLGEIRIFAGNFAPSGWAFCNGQLLSIAQNTALFSLLGTTYGGNGTTTFALPDLRSRVPIHSGQGPGLTERFLGEAAGAESVTLTAPHLPGHRHRTRSNSTAGTSIDAGGNALAAGARPTFGPPGAATALDASSVSSTGGSQPHENRQPYLALSFIIALQGIFPPRS